MLCYFHQLGANLSSSEFNLRKQQPAAKGSKVKVVFVGQTTKTMS